MKGIRSGSIVLLAILLTACSAAIAPTLISGIPVTGKPASTPAPIEKYVNINNLRLDHPRLIVLVGTTVNWTNQDPTVHTLVSDHLNWTPVDMAQGSSFSFQFVLPGIYNYHLKDDPNVTGDVIVF